MPKISAAKIQVQLLPEGKAVSVSLTGAILAGATLEFGVIWDEGGDWAPYISLGSAYGLDISIDANLKEMYNNNGTPFVIGQYEGFGVSDNVTLGYIDGTYGGDIDTGDPMGVFDHGFTYQEFGLGGGEGITIYSRQYVYTWVFDGK